MGRASASPYQVETRARHLERRFALPLTATLRRDIATRPADTTLAEFFRDHLLAKREKAVAVVDGARYLGIVRMEELQAVAQGLWGREHVGDHMRTDFPVVRPGLLIRDALTVMEHADVDLLPVLEGDVFVGVVTTTEILKLDDILGETSGER